MALIRFTHGELVGSMGNNTWQRGRFGAILRQRTTPVDPQTTPQIETRSALSTLSQGWKNDLIQAVRDGWNTYAQNTPWTNTFGDPVTLTGRQMYIRTNLPNLRFRGEVIDFPPSIPGVPSNPQTVTVTATAMSGVEITDIDNNNLGATDFLFVYRAGPFAQSKNFYKGPWTFVDTLDSSTMLPFTVVPAAEVEAGQKWFVGYKLFRAYAVGQEGGLARPLDTRDAIAT